MDSVQRSSITPRKSRLSRTFAKVLNIRGLTGEAHGNQKTKSHGKIKLDSLKSEKVKSLDDEDDDEELRNRAAAKAFLAKLFASLSTVKAAYAQLQFAQSPYDPDGIQASDQLIVSELRNLSEMKQSFLKKQIDDDNSPETTQILAEIQEQKSLLKTYEITAKKLDSQLKLKDSEITFLREKLEEANRENKLLDKRLNSSGQLSVPEDLRLSVLSPTHFILFLRHTTKHVRTFVRVLSREMESAGWDLDAAAGAIRPGTRFYKPSHRCYAFESFVCNEMFDAFNHPNFSLVLENLPEGKRRQKLFFGRFMELKSVKPADFLAWKPKSTFAKFCRTKYSRVIHPKMEASIFGNLDQRNSIDSGEFPETTFFAAFAEMAKRVWLLHCLAFSFDPEATIYQVDKRSRFSEVYMESVSDEAFLSSGDGGGSDSRGTEPRVAFTVVPGFRIGKTVIQCQVYLVNQP